MPYPIKPYISTAAYKVIPTLISNAISTWPNAILTWPNATWRYPKNTYRAYKALFRLKKKV